MCSQGVPKIWRGKEEGQSQPVSRASAEVLTGFQAPGKAGCEGRLRVQEESVSLQAETSAVFQLYSRPYGCRKPWH